MIIESIAVIFFAIAIDLTLGDPKNKFHPTAWIGTLIAKLTPSLKNSSENLEKLGFPREKRPFKGHLTLGRIKGKNDPKKLLGAMKKIEKFESELFMTFLTMENER